MKKLLTLLLVFVLVAFGVWYYSNSQNEPDAPDLPDNGEQNQGLGDSNNDTLSWSTYQNQQYGFSFTYPDSWRVVTSDNNLAPKVTLYGIRRNGEMQPPFDHFVNESHFSVYPQGIPTEGLFGESINVAESDLRFSVALSNDSRIYILNDGTPFAAYLKIGTDAQNKNEKWNSSGYIWLRAYVEDLNTQCFNAEDEELSKADCDPMTEDHSIVWSGSVNTAEWNTLVSIAESFMLTGEAGSGVPEGDMAQNDSIRIESPKIGASVESPLTLEGTVRGSWLFEATAPVVLTNWDGEIISEGYIEAQEDWMTEDFIPFSGTLTFEIPEDMGDFSDTGSLIFKKANPSNLPQNDATLEYTVRFR